MIKSKKIVVIIALLTVAVIVMAVAVACEYRGADSPQKGSAEQGMFMVDTPYVNIPFPEEWEKHLIVEKNEILVEGDVYRLEVYYSPEGKDMIHLFDISFGELEFFIGTINHDGVATKVDIDTSYEIPDSGDYTAGELETAANMQGYYTSIIEYLQELDSFSLS